MDILWNLLTQLKDFWFDNIEHNLKPKVLLNVTELEALNLMFYSLTI